MSSFKSSRDIQKKEGGPDIYMQYCILLDVFQNNVICENAISRRWCKESSYCFCLSQVYTNKAKLSYNKVRVSNFSRLEEEEWNYMYLCSKDNIQKAIFLMTWVINGGVLGLFFHHL